MVNAFAQSALLEPGTPVPAQLAAMDRLRMREYQRNVDFYAGRQWPVQRRNIRNRNLTFNYAKAIVDKTSSYLLNGMRFAVDPLTPGEEAAATHREHVLGNIHKYNRMEELDYDSEVDCAVMGDGCFKVVWDPEVGTVRITSPDVNGIYVWLEPDDHTRYWRLAHRYTIDPLAIRQMEQFYPGLLQWDQREPAITEVWTRELWETWEGQRLIDSRPNPYGFIPYVAYPNVRRPKQFWGESDIENVREVCVEFNRAFSQLSKILEVSGNPITVLEGVTDSKDIAVEPGSVWELPPGTKAYLLSMLEHGGVTVHLGYLQALYQVLHDLAEAPRSAFGGSAASGARSGTALAIELDPLIKRVQRKRLVRTSMFARRTEMALRLWEQFTGEDMRPYESRIIWGPLLPIDRSRDVLDEISMVNAGLHSRGKAASNLGDLDHEIDFARWLHENKVIAGDEGIPAEPSQSDRLQVS